MLNSIHDILPKNCKDNSHYFTFAKAKVYSIIKLCNNIKIEYFKENIFQIFNFLIEKNEDFSVIILFFINYIIIQIAENIWITSF